MNQQQKTFIATKTHYSIIERDLDKKEDAFCRSKGYKTDRGGLATRLYLIDDDDIFEEASKEFYDLCGISRRDYQV